MSTNSKTMQNNSSDHFPRHERENAVIKYNDSYLPDGTGISFPGPLMRSDIKMEDVLNFIQRKSEECLQHIQEPNQREAYFFWKMMKLHCSKKGKVLLPDIAALLLKHYKLLRKRLGIKNQDTWCFPLAKLLSSAKPEDKKLDDVVQLGKDLDSKGQTYAAQLCYMAALEELDIFKSSHFELIGCKSLPISRSALREAIERTEVYEYVCSLTTGLPQSNFQIFKCYHASKLAEHGLSDQALEYCKIIARAIAKFPREITKTTMETTIALSEKLHQGKETEPGWLIKLRQLYTDEQFMPHNPKGGLMNSEMFNLPRAREHSHVISWEEFDALYDSDTLLGEGGMGQVYGGHRRADGRQVAMKYVPLDHMSFITIPGETRSLPAEVALMKMVSKPNHHENILELIDWFEMIDWYILVLERPIPCTDLRQFIKDRKGRLYEPQAQHIMRQVVQAARYCCDCGVLHRDIKDSNILINTDTMQIKLTDFGCGDLLKDTPYSIFSGTRPYAPPEWLTQKKYMGIPSTVWSLGVVLFKMMCGRLPFRSRKDIIERNMHFSPGLSETCRDLILWCLQLQPNSRPSFREILSHEWFGGSQKNIKRPFLESHINISQEEFKSLYTVGELLGEGINATVHAGVRKADGKQVALKYLDKTQSERFINISGEIRSLPVEVALLKKVSRPPGCKNVVEMIEWFEMSDCYVLVLERLSPCMNVQEFLRLHNGRLSETLAKKIMTQVVEATQHCCNAGVFHGDLKAENLLINPDTLEVKLIDFGCGDLFTGTPLTEYKGTWHVCPPEWVREGEFFARPATIWALGVLLFYLICGHYPFYSKDDIINSRIDLPPDLSEGCCNLIFWCLDRTAEFRLTFGEILNHDWFMNEQFEGLM